MVHKVHGRLERHIGSPKGLMLRFGVLPGVVYQSGLTPMLQGCSLCCKEQGSVVLLRLV